LPIQKISSNQEIFDDLALNHPVFYADTHHAMTMVGAQGVGSNPIGAWVLDPAPLQPMSFGPITAPGVPAVGLRTLTPQEMSGFFVAQVAIRSP
jgi:hypothetical protein